MLAHAAPARAQVREVGLGDVLAAAASANQEALQADQAARAAQAEANSALGHFGPSLRAEGNYIYWEEAQQVSLSGGSGGATPALPHLRPPMKPSWLA